MALIKINENINTVFGVIEQYGHIQYPGAPVSFIEHSLQAGMNAAKDTQDEELVLAAFFHDIGHLCGNVKEYGDTMVLDHEKAGALFLAQHGFSERIVSLVEYHVLAKRYLTYKYPDFYLSLTETARESLEYQGGPLGMDEALRFEAHPLFSDLIRLRKWDEGSKIRGAVTPALYEFRYMAMYHLICQSNGLLV